MSVFSRLNKKLGFGLMRLPVIGEEVDIATTKAMVDTFMEAGFIYFDTAHGYLGGKSELAIRECLTSRYPRESYILTNKLSTNFFETNEQIRPLLDQQLKACGVDYFDFYLMHAQDVAIYAKFKACRAYETALQLRSEGKFKHFGISFHDRPELLDQILTEYPQIEVVQIQLNYLDYDDSSVQSRKCLDVCHKHGKKVIVMEPVKGGSLVNLPEDAQNVLRKLGGGSNASYAIRFAAGQKDVIIVLSGMNTVEMVMDNCGYMADFQPLNEKEQAAIGQVRDIIRSYNTIACTGCRYCTEVCPQSIPIPGFFACYNTKKIFNNWNTDYYFHQINAWEGSTISDCLKCGLCEGSCPQHLPIRDLLDTVREEFADA